MATALKTGTQVITNLAPGVGTTTTGSNISLTTAMGCTVAVRCANTTAPTSNPAITINISHDGSTYTQFFKFSVPTTASTTFEYGIEIPPSVMNIRIDCSSGTGTVSTFNAWTHVLTSIQ